MLSLDAITYLDEVERLEPGNHVYDLLDAEDFSRGRTPHAQFEILPTITGTGFVTLEKTPQGFPPLQLNLRLAVENRPWLPPEAHHLIQQLRKRPLSEKEAVALMRLLAERNIEYYGFEDGQFLAISFEGRVMETSDSVIVLMRKLQGTSYSGNVFIWEVGSESLAGWI